MEGNITTTTTSKSHFEPRTLECYTKYLGCTQDLKGHLYLKRSSTSGSETTAASPWIKCSVVFERGTTLIYKCQDSDDSTTTTTNSIELKDVYSVSTCKDFGPFAFQIILVQGNDTDTTDQDQQPLVLRRSASSNINRKRLIFKADSQDQMQEWLFEFQRSIAHVVASIVARSSSSFVTMTGDNITRQQQPPLSSHNLQLPSSTFSNRRSSFHYPLDELVLDSDSAADISLFSEELMFQVDDIIEKESIVIVNDSSSSARWIPPHQRTRNSTTTRTTEDNVVSLQENIVALSNLTSAHSTLMGIRSSMEDVVDHIISYDDDDDDNITESSYFAIYDGHSGKRASEYCKVHLANLIKSHRCFHSDLKTAIADSFESLDSEFLKIARRENFHDGSTVLVIIKRGDELYSAQLGDSKATIGLKNNTALDIVSEITPGDDEESDRIKSRGGWIVTDKELHMSRVHSMDLADPAIRENITSIVKWTTSYRVNGELAISRSIGDMDYKGNESILSYPWGPRPNDSDDTLTGEDLVIATPRISVTKVLDGMDFIILASDGLWDVCTSQLAVANVSETLRVTCRDVQAASDTLAKLAMRYGSSDNVSVIVVLL